MHYFRILNCSRSQDRHALRLAIFLIFAALAATSCAARFGQAIGSGQAPDVGTPDPGIDAPAPRGNGIAAASTADPVRSSEATFQPFVRTLVAALPAATGGLTVAPNGDLFVADIGRAPGRRGQSIYQISAEGEVLLFAQESEVSGASGNVFGPSGRLFQASFTAGAIHAFTLDGRVSLHSNEGLSGPVGIAVDKDENLYVANCRAQNILLIRPDGQASVYAESLQFNCPNGIARGEDGVLYVANFGDGRVLRVDPDGAVDLLAELPGGNNGHILYAGRKLYVVDRGGHQIFQLSLEGELTRLAGTGERGQEDGPALEASFALPNGIGISPDATRLYINEVDWPTSASNFPAAIRVIHLADR